MRYTNHLRNSIKHIQKIISQDQNVVNVDRYRVSIKAGNGGTGLARYNGVGGSGGNVYFVTRPDMAFTAFPTAKAFKNGKMVAKAENGLPSIQTRLNGEKGNDLVLPIPLGVEIVEEERNLLLARPHRVHQRILIARGGEGGHSGNGFIPQKGEQVVVTVHLKLRPNIGLVGFPNAGKSTLLQAFLPRKSVKIAPYPFTTLKPQIGFWSPNKVTPEEEEPFTLTLADLPGLIEGASQNRGKGYQFLKHLEYCGVLLLVIDVNGFQLKNSLGEPFRNALETIALLNIELESYDKRITRKPAVVFVNKLDIAKDIEGAHRLRDTLRETNWWKDLPKDLQPKLPLTFDGVVLASAKNGDIDELKNLLTRIHKNSLIRDIPEDLLSKPTKYLV
ncbi:unnamed protein product, partial [Mesorhabditis belari]|uniref:GTP-binding protein 10 n=1 Tax=Mesorhabditis belari TaxID=2138241 RepID=A0AAF3FMV1_9BILA